MPKYSPVIIFYIIVQLTSLLLLSILIVLLLKSKSHFTKWTLFQLFISAFGNGFSALPPIIMYGDELANRAFESSACIISNKIANFSLYPLEFFSLVIAFYLWHALVTHRLDIEKKCFWYVSGAIWLYNIAYNTFELLNSSKHYKDWGIRVSILNCKTTTLNVNFYGYIIPTLMIIFITIIMTCHSSVILYKRWKNFNSNMNRITAIRLGHAVRLYILCVMIIIVMLLVLIPRIIYNDNNYNPKYPTILFPSFVSASVGTLIFLIFGTNTRAAIFLPFCYYVPHDKPLTQVSLSCIA